MSRQSYRCHLGPPNQLRNQNRECPGLWCKCTRHSEATVSGDLPQTSGVQVFGRRNFLTINAHSHDSGRNIIFEKSAHDSPIVATNLPNGITNLAKTPTNRIIPCWPIGFNVPTPNFPTSGETVINEQPYQIEILILTSGNVSSWGLTDANGNTQTVCAGLSAGQCLVLEPGDQIHSHGGAWMEMASVKVGMWMKHLLFGLQHIISVLLHSQHI